MTESLDAPQSPKTLSKSASVPAGSLCGIFRAPDYLSTKKLTKRRYLPPSTGNLHGLRSDDYLRAPWPLPHMFGDEEYAFEVIDIDDQRYLKEIVTLSKKLVRFFYDQQIMDYEWRKTYKKFLMCEHRRDTLSRDAAQKTKDKMESDVLTSKKYLLELQSQRDLLRACINEIWARCDDIKAVIKKENDLECLRKEMNIRVRDRYSPDDEFWNQAFNIRSSSTTPQPGH
eukprot:GEMP01063013.1.p1 GENE.GEMP01063013.1~~GEMP01063013.1.p1  ORF type:complete len:228 (+),score=33.02 GEMP01063013.1:30-713(+)